MPSTARNNLQFKVLKYFHFLKSKPRKHVENANPMCITQ
jgi:hypothetical protein